MNFTFIKNFDAPHLSFLRGSVTVLCFLLFTFSVPITNAVNTLGRPEICIVFAGIAFAAFIIAWNIVQQKQINAIKEKSNTLPQTSNKEGHSSSLH